MKRGSFRKTWSQEVKNSAIKLRRADFSYNEISRQTGIPKSTLNNIFEPLRLTGVRAKFDTQKHLKKIHVMAMAKIKKNRQERLAIIRQAVVKEVSENLLVSNQFYGRSLLAMLYWAEGSKTRGSLDFVNTDPFLMLFYLTLLRQTYNIDEEKLRVRLHLHHYHDVEKTKKFWSELLKIPLSKFGKIYIKQRSQTKKFRQNFAGICFVRYHDEKLRNQILNTGEEIATTVCHSSRHNFDVPIAQLDRARPCGG